MRYSSPMLIFALIFSVTMNAQQVFYSTPVKNPYDITDNYIIGKVKNNIVVWKHLATNGESELLIYDYDMKLQNRVPLKFFSKGELYRIDFINRQTVFDIIVQYYIGRTFYCKIERFNEKGEMLEPIKTIDALKIKDNAKNELYGVIQSEDNQYIGLVQALLGVKKGCLQLNYTLIDASLNIVKRKESLINFDKSNNELSALYLDNKGSLVFAKSMINTPSSPNNYVVIYKIEKDNDTLLNIIHSTGNNFVQDLNLLVNNDSYIVSGIYQNKQKEISQQDTAAKVGLFTSIVNTDLSEKAEDNYYPLNKIKGIDLYSLKDAAVSIKSIINKGDSGFVITCGVNDNNSGNFFPVNYARSQPFNSSDQRFNTSDQPFYRRPDLSKLTPVYSNTLVPTSPVYWLPGSGSGPCYKFDPATKPNTIAAPEYSFTSEAESKNLFLLSVTNKNEPQWSLALATPIGNWTFYSVGFSNTSNFGDALHVIYSEEISGTKRLLKQVVVTSNGEAILKPIISNNFHYLFQTHEGTQIDNHSVVFPCEVKGWLSFARVEFD